MIEREKFMVATDGNIMRKTPQEAYDLIENMTQHHFQWDAEVYYDTTTGVSAHYSKTTLVSDKDEALEADKSEIDPLINESTYTFLMGDEEIELNSHEDIDDLVPIPRVSEKPLDSLDPISNNFDMTITNPLFDFDYEFTLNSDNPIFDIQYEDSDESEMETIMDKVLIHNSKSAAQILPQYEKLLFDMTMSSPILTLSQIRYGILGSYRILDILGSRLFYSLSYNS
ncbi:hypothetical protein Tco_1271846, partial [Tanacetum coccineum]